MCYRQETPAANTENVNPELRRSSRSGAFFMGITSTLAAKHFDEVILENMPAAEEKSDRDFKCSLCHKNLLA
jgi:hypothetical protein